MVTQTYPTKRSFQAYVSCMAPGLLLCLAVAGGAYGLEIAEVEIVGKAWLEPLVLAILLGIGIRTLWAPSEAWHQGIAFSAKYPLEIAIVLLGASMSVATVAAAGAMLLLGIAAVVLSAIILSFGIGKLLRLPTRLALLIACGNSICGNSAIAAVAPIIGADSDDVAASIAFTAVLGVGVVIGLPLLGTVWNMTGVAYGAFAGLVVYAVPQVIAAASPLGAGAIQMGTLVKLVRVLMLGPVCLMLSVLASRTAWIDGPADRVFAGGQVTDRRLSLTHLVPWFIIGFLMLLTWRSLGLIPIALSAPLGRISTLLTVISMGALGLSVEVRAVAKAGARVTTTVLLSLAGLGAISLALLRILAYV